MPKVFIEIAVLFLIEGNLKTTIQNIFITITVHHFPAERVSLLVGVAVLTKSSWSMLYIL